MNYFKFYEKWKNYISLDCERQNEFRNDVNSLELDISDITFGDFAKWTSINGWRYDSLSGLWNTSYREGKMRGLETKDLITRWYGTKSQITTNTKHGTDWEPTCELRITDCNTLMQQWKLEDTANGKVEYEWRRVRSFEDDNLNQ